MKHTVKRVIGGLLIAALMLPLAAGLTSCSGALRLNTMKESERALEFVDILDENMKSQGSYAMDMDMTMTLEVYRTEVSMVATGTATVVGSGTDDYFIHTETHQTMSMSGEDTEITTIEGFADGKMFHYYAENGVRATKLWSPISAGDYMAFEAAYDLAESLNNDVMGEEAATRTCVQNDDKTWTATYTDYTPAGLATTTGSLEGLESMMEGVYLEDLVITVYASKDLLPTGMEIEFVFAAEETDNEVTLPVVEAKATYRDIGTTEAFEVDLENYYEVEDLRVPTIVEKSLRDFLSADKAEFKVMTSQKAEYKGQSTGVSETDTGTFEVGEDGYTFEIVAKTGGEKYDITYKDGTYLMMQGDVRKAKRYWSEAEAKTYMRGLLDPATFSTSKIKRIEKDEEASQDGKTVYLLTLRTEDLTEYENAAGVNLSGVTTMRVTIEDGRMTEQVYLLSMTSGIGYKMTVSANCSYISFTEKEAS